MGSWIDLVMTTLVLTNLLLVSTSQLKRGVKIIAFEGLLLASLPILVELPEVSLRSVVFALAIATLKGGLIPTMLLKAIKEAKEYRETDPILGHTISILIASAAFIGSLMVSRQLPWPEEPLSQLIVPVAFFSLFVGIFMIVSRSQAVSQVIGYLQLEFGLFIFGMSHPYEHSFLVETAVLLDILIAVLVMGIAIRHINKALKHTDTRQLSVLRDFRR